MNEILNYSDIIEKNPLFSGINSDEMTQMLALLCGRCVSFKKGSIIHQPWTKMSEFGLVLSGIAQACCDDFDGNRMIMAEIPPGVTFGESLCFLQITNSPVYIFASQDVEILWLSLKNLYDKSNDSLVLNMQKRFTALLAARTLSMNNRIQTLSKITIRDKLMFYFSDMSANCKSNSFDIPFNREDLATYIGADRAAVSRELSKMKREGIIDYNKNHFILKRKIYK